MTASRDQGPVAWLFRNADGSTRVILDDPKRVAAWRPAHEGEIIPLYAALTDAEREAIEEAIRRLWGFGIAATLRGLLDRLGETDGER